MRAHVPVTGASGLTRDAHVCWVYDDPGELPAVARQFLANGLARGERLFVVGDGSVDGVVAAFPGAVGLVDDGGLVLARVTEAYAAGPEEQHAFYDAQTRAALADGYTGLRVFAEVTPLATDPARLGEHVRWEHLADSYLAGGHGMSAICAYRGDLLTEETLVELESVHPQVRSRAGAAPFRLYFEDRRLVLVGTLDTFGADRLARTLATSPVAGPVVTLDLSGLDFSDARGCATVAGFAHRLDRRAESLRVVGAPRMFVRAWDVLGYGRIGNATVTRAAR